MFKFIKNQDKKFKAIVICLIALIFLMISIFTMNFFTNKKYNNKIIVSNATVKTFKTDNNKEIKKDELINSSDELSYKILYTLETKDKKQLSGRTAIVKATLSDEENNYATWELVKDTNIESEIVDSGKTLMLTISNVTTNKQYEVMAKLKIVNAPNEFKISPKVTVEEKTSKEKFVELKSESGIVNTKSISGKIFNEQKGYYEKNLELELCKLIDGSCINTKTTYTNSDGSFSFSELENGIYQINIKNNNYALLEEINPLTITDNSLNINIKVANQTKFRASIKKYIDKIEINENGQTKEYNYKEVDQAVVSVKKMQNTKIKITYKFVIKNESTKEGYVKVIKENLPEGLEFNPEYEENTNWYIHDGKIYNKSLAQEPLEAFEEKELYITLNSKTTDLAKSYLNKVSMTGENYYTVKYVANNEVIKEESVIDSDILEKFDIEREGYTFEGWYTDKEYKNKYDFTKPVEDDLVLYAKLINNNKKCIVKYLRQNGKLFAEKEIDCGTKAEDIEGPKDEEGYKFNCWEKAGEKECFDFNKTVDEDTELTSHMDQYFDVKFYEEDGKTSYEKKKYDQEIKRGDYAKEPEKVPSKKGHEFECWKDLSTGKCFDFSNTPIDDKKDFIPSFKADQNRVIYVDEKNEENIVFKTYDKVDYGKEVPKPNTVPTHEGYTFTYWATKDENNNYVEFDYENNKMPDNDLYLYAQYTTNVHNVTFIDEKQETDNIYEIVENVEYGSLIIKTKADPYHAGFYFTGWAYKNKNDKLTKFDLTKDTMPDNDLTLYAQYTDNKHEVIYKIPECTGDSCESTPKCTGDECIIEKIDVPDGEVLTPPEDPVKECYTFKYWSLYETGLDENGKESRYDFGTPIKKDTIIYAIFEVTKYDVTYVDNGVVIKTEKVKCGKTIPTDDPNKCDKNDKNCDNTCTDPEGCPDFVCWRDADDPSKCLPSTPANKNLTLVSYYVNLPEPIVLHTPTEWTNESKTIFNEKNNEKVSVQMNFPTDAKIVYKTTKKTVSEDGTVVYNVEEKETTENLTLTSSDYDIKYQVVAEKDIDDETTTFGKYDLSNTWKLYESPFEIEKNAIIVGKVSTKNKVKEYASSHLKHEVKNIDKKSPVIDSVEADNITYQSFDIKLNSKDLQSGVKQFNIYLNGEKYGETKKLEDAKKESNETFTVSGLEELTTYTIKLEIFDDVGNMTTSDDQEVTTVEKGHEPVAQIIGRFGNLYEDEGTYEIFYSLEDARKSCGDNQCTVQMLKSTNESIDILDSQDITLDLNGKKVIGVKDYTINNSGNFIVIDDYGYQNNEEYGGIFNNNDNGISINNYSTGTLTLGVNETPQSVNIVKPLIHGTKYGIYAEDVSTLNFYDGLVKGKIAIYGTVDDTPYLYNVAIRMENTIQTAKLSVLTDAEARVNKTKYYTKIANAVSDPSTAKGVTTQTLTSKNLLELISQDNTTNFVYDEETGTLKNNNSFIDSTASGYLTLDLTQKTDEQLLIINAECDSNKTATITIEEYDEANSKWVFKKKLMETNEPTEAKDYEINLEPGKLYRINLLYEAKYSNIKGLNTDTFKINSVKLEGEANYYIGKTKSGEDSFSFTNNSFPIRSMYYIDGSYNTTSEKYFTASFDLTKESEDKTLYLNYNITDGRGLYSLKIYNGEYNDSSATEIYSAIEKSDVIERNDYVTLKAGQINYITYVFTQITGQNYGTASHGLCINDMSIVADFDIDNNITNGSRYYFKKDAATGYYISNNKRNSTKATSYVKIDTTNNESVQDYSIKYEISSEKYDYGHIYLSESQDVTDSSTKEILSISGASKGSETITLDPGKIYYVHFAYEKDSSGSENEDCFKIISINKNKRYIPARQEYTGEYTSQVKRVKLNEKADTVQLIRNINMQNTLIIPSEQKLILDLNGHTLTNTDGDSVIQNNGHLTIIDSVFDEKVALAYNELKELQAKNDADAVELQKQYDEDYKTTLSMAGKYTATDYIQNGLELQVDFKADIIKRTGQENYGLIVPAYDRYGAPTFKDDYVQFDGVNDFLDLGEVNYSNITIELMAESESTLDGQVFYSNANYGGYSLSTDSGKVRSSTAHTRGKWTSLYGPDVNTEKNTYTITSDGKKVIIYENGQKISYENVTSPIYQTEDNRSLTLGARYNTSKTGILIPGQDYMYYDNFFKGKIYSIRVYSRALTESEIQDNYNVDLDYHNLKGEPIHKKAVAETATLSDLDIEATGTIIGNSNYGVRNEKGAYLSFDSGIMKTQKSDVTIVYNNGTFDYSKYTKIQASGSSTCIENSSFGIMGDTSGKLIGNSATLISNESARQKELRGLNLSVTDGGTALEIGNYALDVYDSYIYIERSYGVATSHASSPLKLNIYNSTIHDRNRGNTDKSSVDFYQYHEESIINSNLSIYNSEIEGKISTNVPGIIDSTTFENLVIGDMSNAAQKSDGKITINNSVSTGTISSYKDDESSLEINDSKCTYLSNYITTVINSSKLKSVSNSGNGTIEFNGISSIKNSQGSNAIGLKNTGTAYSIKFNDYFVLESSGNGIKGNATLGNKSIEISDEYPKIIAKGKAIEGNINYYSGLITGKIDDSISGFITPREEYDLNITKDADASLETVKLNNERKVIKNSDTGEEYRTLKDAFETVPDNEAYNFELIDNVYTALDSIVPENKQINIDTKGYNIESYNKNFFTNLGILNVNDSTSVSTNESKILGATKIKSQSEIITSNNMSLNGFEFNNLVNNSGILTIDNAEVYATTNSGISSSLITNDSTFEKIDNEGTIVANNLNVTGNSKENKGLINEGTLTITKGTVEYLYDENGIIQINDGTFNVIKTNNYSSSTDESIKPTEYSNYLNIEKGKFGSISSTNKIININNGKYSSISSSGKYAILTINNLELCGGLNNTDNSNVIINDGTYNDIYNNANAEINNGSISQISNSSILNMSGGHIRDTASNTGTFTMTGKSYSECEIQNEYVNVNSKIYRYGTFTMGIKDQNVVTNYPSIKGIVGGNMNFYDGNTLEEIGATLKDSEDGYRISYGKLYLDYISTEEPTNCYYLDKRYVVKNISKNISYFDLQDAITEADENNELQILMEIIYPSNSDPININSDKKITIDLNSHYIENGPTVNNNGNLKLINSSEGIQNANINLVNNKTLYADNVYITTVKNTSSGTATIGTIKGLDIENSGNLSIEKIESMDELKTLENGTTIVNSGEVKKISFSDSSTGTLKKIKGKYISTSVSPEISNLGTGTINIESYSNGHINNKNSGNIIVENFENCNEILNESSGTITIENGNETISGTGLFRNKADGIINIKRGTYSSTTSSTTGGLFDTIGSTGTINIGTKGDKNSDGDINVSQSQVTLTGPLGNVNKINFYDGKIMINQNIFKTTSFNRLSNLSFNSFEDGYYLTHESEIVDSKNYYSFYLTKEKSFENTTKNKKYSNIYDAINDSTSGDTIKCINSYISSISNGKVLVDSSKNLTMDLNGKFILFAKELENNSSMNFIDSQKSSDTFISLYGNIVSNNDVKFNDVKIKADITNTGNLTAKKSTLSTITSTGTLDNNIILDSSTINSINSSGNTINIENSTINSMTAKDSANLTLDSGTISLLKVLDNSVFNLNDGTISTKLIVQNKSSMTMNNGTISKLYNLGSTIVVENGNISDFNIESYDSSSYSSEIIYFYDSDTSINGGTITTLSASTSYKSLIINDGNFDTVSNSTRSTMNINGGTISSLYNTRGDIIIKKADITTIFNNEGYIETYEGLTANLIYMDDDKGNYSIPVLKMYGSKVGALNFYYEGHAYIFSGTITKGIDLKNSTVDIGTKDGIVDLKSPSISGENYAIKIGEEGIVNFYDGILTGPVDNVYVGKIKSYEPGYKMVSTKNADGKTESIVLGMVSEDESNVTMNGINFPDIQTAINSATSNEPVITLQRNNEISSQIEIPEGYNVKIYLNNFTITYGDIVISKNDISKLSSIITGNGTMTVMDSDASGVSAAINSLLAVNKLNKRIVLYQTDDGNKLEITRNYKLYKLNGTNYYKVNVEEDSENVGRYLVTKANNNIVMTTINGKIYLKGLESGNYKVVDDNSKEIIFNITDDGKVSGNVKEMGFVDFNKIISQSKALLTVTIQTGIEQRKYGLLILLISTICGLLYLVKTKVSKNN